MDELHDLRELVQRLTLELEAFKNPTKDCKYVGLTLQRGDLIEIGPYSVMLSHRRTNGAALVVRAPKEMFVKLVKASKSEGGGP